MKKLLVAGLYILSLLLVLVLSGLIYVFIRPEVVLNPAALDLLLKKTSLLKSWSWDKGAVEHKWHGWNDRTFSGEFKNFCFEYRNEGAIVKTCLDSFSWNFRVKWDWEQGGRAKSLEPIFLRSKLLELTLLATGEQKDDTPPDIWKYWQLLWGPLIPDMDIEFKKIVFKKEDSLFDLDLKVLKKARILEVVSWKIHLNATPHRFLVKIPSPYKIPKDLKLSKPLYLRKVELSGEMKEDGIPLKLTGGMEFISVDVRSYLKLPLKREFMKDFLLKTSAQIEVLGLKEQIKNYVPAPFNQLPAPFNVMDGSIFSEIKINESERKDDVLVSSKTLLDLTGEGQDFKVAIQGSVPLNVKTFSPGQINLEIDLQKVLLELPRLSRTSPPPQFFPDKRFKKNLTSSPKKPEKNLDLSLDLVALEEEALHIKTNLLDEALRLKFDLKIRQGKMDDGFLEILPLKTTVFKRPIRLDNLLISFESSRAPVLNATVHFPLPEYKITLKLEGPLNDPRYVFSSVPPLPQNDIFAVLLFGRPVAELDPDDKGAATQTNKILAQGILSLSVLYFLAGSPVEYVGYDAESKQTSAQFGLGSKSSLRVGGSKEGVNSTSIRRSLGKGWYIDTSVQDSSTPTTGSSQNYGVLLERIIAY